MKEASTIATILLVRHAAHGELGTVLSGRREGVELSPAGAAQADRLARALKAAPPDLVQTSPVLRARRTAEAIGEMTGRKPQVEDALNEVDFGVWTGRPFAELEGQPAWTEWNEHRSCARAPGGENMVEAQKRVVRHVERTATQRPEGTVAMVTHCDIIRALAAAVLGLSLDHILRFDIGPASVSRIAVQGGEMRLTSLNETPASLELA